MSVAIRPARAGDVATILGFIRDFGAMVAIEAGARAPAVKPRRRG